MDNNESYRRNRRGRKNRRNKNKKSKGSNKTIKIFISVIFAAVIIFAIAYGVTSSKWLVSSSNNDNNYSTKIDKSTETSESKKQQNSNSNDIDSQGDENIAKSKTENTSIITLTPIEKSEISLDDYNIYKEYNNNSSSHLIYKGKSYPADYINDFKNNTAWNEGVEGDGVGEWIEIKMNSPKKINGILIQNGYKKTEELYYQNNRPKTLRIDVADYESFYVDFNDNYNDGFLIKFPETYETTGITVTILAVYEGSKYEDTCISELKLVYKK